MALRDKKDSRRQQGRKTSTKPFIAIAIFVLTTVALPTMFQQPSGAASVNLTVSSQDSSGNALTGFWTVVSQSGATVQSGYTPFSASLAQGTYSVSIGDFGSYVFSHWSDGTTTRAHTVIIPSSGAITLMAVYSKTAGSPSTLTVNSQDSSGHALTGYYIVISQNGATVQSSFTPFSTPLTAGTYSVTVGDYGSYFFSHWSDGVTTRAHSVTMGSTAVTLTAVYSTTSGGSANLVVNSVDSSGSSITGYWTAISQGSSTVKTGFTPFSTTLSAGTYSVSVSDYGSYVFSHWSDGTTTRAHAVTIGTTTVSLTAVYSSTVSGGGHPGSDGTGLSKGGANSITVYAARIPSIYWAPCFALVCKAGTGPGAQMYVALEDANGNVIATAFTDENGYTFTGLDTSKSFYLLYPDDCNFCHNDPHNVVFSHWQDGSTTRPRQVGTGEAYTAWYQYVPLT